MTHTPLVTALLAGAFALGLAQPAAAQYVNKRSSTSYAVQGPTKAKRSETATSQQRGQTLSTQQRSGAAQTNAVGQSRTQTQKR